MKNLRDYVNNNQVCSLPWIHAEVNLQNNKVKPCCKFYGNLGDVSNEFKVTWFDKEFLKLRSDMLELAPNAPPASCFPCNVPNDVFSYKSWKNKSYQSLLDVDIDNPTLPKVFNFSLKNTCNLACRMCNPAQSSKLEQITKKNPVLQQFYDLPPINNKIDINQMKGSFTNARYITFAGGEPMIDEDCLALIKIIKDESKKLFAINFATNMTTVNDEMLAELESLNCQVKLSISIDGPKHIHEYIRYKCEWETIMSNIYYINKRYPKIQFAVNTTVSVLNVGYVTETLSFFHQLEKDINKKLLHLMVSPVIDKDFLHPSILPEYCKKQYLEKISSFTETATIPDSQNLLPTAIHMLQEPAKTDPERFKQYIAEFDRIAKTDVLEVYPEFKQWFGSP